MKPGGLALAKACTRIFQPDGQAVSAALARLPGGALVRGTTTAGCFRKTGLLVAGPNDDSSALREGRRARLPDALRRSHPDAWARAWRPTARATTASSSIGPFNCLPFRISEAILKPLSIQRGMPILTYESDGYAVSPSFLRQVDVHIQQVLDHAARNSEAARTVTGGGGLAGFLKSAVGKLY